MSVNKDQQHVITTVLILLEATFVVAGMDMNWNQIITLVQVMTTTIMNHDSGFIIWITRKIHKNPNRMLTKYH